MGFRQVEHFAKNGKRGDVGGSKHHAGSLSVIYSFFLYCQCPSSADVFVQVVLARAIQTNLGNIVFKTSLNLFRNQRTSKKEGREFALGVCEVECDVKRKKRNCESLRQRIKTKWRAAYSIIRFTIKVLTALWNLP